MVVATCVELSGWNKSNRIPVDLAVGKTYGIPILVALQISQPSEQISALIRRWTIFLDAPSDERRMNANIFKFYDGLATHGLGKATQKKISLKPAGPTRLIKNR